MYNLGPLDALRRTLQRLQREGNYWLSRVTRLFPGGRGRPARQPDLEDFKGSPVLLIAVGCLATICLCAFAILAITALLIAMQQMGV